MPKWPCVYLFRHEIRYRRDRAGSMPSSRSCGGVREKRASHDGNLDACLTRSRPISLRKVGTSGTSGIGSGIVKVRLLDTHLDWIAGDMLGMLAVVGLERSKLDKKENGLDGGIF